MFDANLVLMDGSVVTTITTDTPSASLTRNATTGTVVLDLKKTGVKGLTAVMVLSELADGADAYALTAFLEASDVLAFTSDLHKLVSFDLAGATAGVILGIETPAIIAVQFVTTKRYLRINATVSNDFGYIQVLVTNRFKFI